MPINPQKSKLRSETAALHILAPLFLVFICVLVLAVFNYHSRIARLENLSDEQQREIEQLEEKQKTIQLQIENLGLRIK